MSSSRGQGAIDPATGELVGADVATQTEQVFKNIQAILQAAGTDLSRVVRCGVFLVDMGDFQAMNAAYARAFGEHRPTLERPSRCPRCRTRGLRVEIDAVAYLP